MAGSERKIERLLPAMAASDGAGVRLKRSIGTPSLDHLDPFLLLDQFDTANADDYIAGFPDHPHRGFETVTYMIDGRMRHQDTSGGGGVLRSGGVQLMTAGRGIVHSEMPEQEDGLMKGFQLWVNLPARDKMSPPRYQNIEPEDVPEIVRDDGAKVRVVAGSYDGVAGAVGGISVDPLYLDVGLAAGARVEIPVPAGHAAFVYAFEGMARSLARSLIARCQMTLNDVRPAKNASSSAKGLRAKGNFVLGAHIAATMSPGIELAVG